MRFGYRKAARLERREEEEEDDNPLEADVDFSPSSSSLQQQQQHYTGLCCASPLLFSLHYDGDGIGMDVCVLCYYCAVPYKNAHCT